MANSVENNGKKMGDYTPLAAGEKEYFLGDGEGSVVAVGKTSSETSTTNRLVKLSDIAGDKLPSGGTEGQVLTKTANGEAWAAVPTELPSNGTAGQFLKKTDSGVEYASVNEVPSGGTVGQVLTKTATGEAWAAVPTELPSSGTAGQFLKKTASGVEYASVSEVPSGGTAGQVLTKTASGNEWAAVPTELPSGGTAGQVLTKTENSMEWGNTSWSIAEDPTATTQDEWVYIDRVYNLNIGGTTKSLKFMDDTISGTPVNAPTRIGRMCIDTYDSNIWIGTGTNNVDKYTLITNHVHNLIVRAKTLTVGGTESVHYILCAFDRKKGPYDAPVFDPVFATGIDTWINNKNDIIRINGTSAIKPWNENYPMRISNVISEVPADESGRRCTNITITGHKDGSATELSFNGTLVIDDSNKGYIEFLDWNTTPISADVPSGGNVGDVLTQTANGPAWDTVSSVELTETTIGGITDTSGNNILDANNEIIGDSSSETFVSGINSKNILAKRTYEDEDGNNIKATYVKKEDILPPVIDGGTLTDAASITVDNNALSKLSTSQSTLTLNVDLAAGEVANFAVEIAAGANVTLTVTSTTGSTVKTLYKSTAGGNSLESGKFYQVTCVGSCWTLAEFEAPSA